MDSSPFLERFPGKIWEGTDERTVGKGVAALAVMLMILEFVCVYIFFWAGRNQQTEQALVFQILFTALAAMMEYISYKKLGEPFGDEIVQTVFFIPVHRLHIPKWIFLLATLAPNYTHVISSAVAAGCSYVVWNDPPKIPPGCTVGTLHQDHIRNWEDTPIIGHIVASTGIPSILTSLVLASMIFHSILPAFWFVVTYLDGGGDFRADDVKFLAGEVCDCANLQFLKHALMHGEDEVDNLSRLLIGCCIKYPLIWAKTSFAAVMWDYMTQEMQRSMLFALMLAWYGVLQLMPAFVRTTYEFTVGRSSGAALWLRCIVCTALTVLVPGLSQQALHLGGIWWCPDTHDFSILHGCTSEA